MAHTCSVLERLGDQAGFGRMLTICKHGWVMRTVCGCSLSCWNSCPDTWHRKGSAIDSGMSSTWHRAVSVIQGNKGGMVVMTPGVTTVCCRAITCGLFLSLQHLHTCLR